MSKQSKADFSLFLVTIGWGASFALTKNALGDLETYNFLALRFLIAFAFSSIVFYKQMLKINKQTLKAGFIVGVLLFTSFALQTVGLTHTTVSKSAFITGFNVVLVPIFSALLLKKKPEKSAVTGAFLAFIGLGLLALNDGQTTINIGDFYTLLSAILFALYILAVGKYTVDVDSISFAVLQIGVVGIFSWFTSLVIEHPILPVHTDVWIDIIILSIVCTSGAYIVQSVAQKFTTSTHTALIYTGEPVFAAIFGYFLFGEMLTQKGMIGATLILLGMLVAEIDLNKLFAKTIPSA
jgi:drug/metabolite transporter (DMT)-like permease